MGAALAASLLAVLAIPTPASAARPGQAILAAKASRDSARTVWVRERWSGTFPALRAAQARLDQTSARYRAALRESELPSKITAKERETWTDVAMDLAEEGIWSRALTLLRGPLASPASLRPIEALAAGRVQSPSKGLEAMAWPPDQVPRGGIKTDEAGLFVVATLADSAGLLSTARSARWLLVDERRPVTARSWARGSLARSLARGGETLLAKEMLTRATSRTSSENLLLADLTASGGDTMSATHFLAGIAGRAEIPTADRYAAARRAAAWVQGPAADSLGEREWMGLLRALADVGEASLALRVMDARKKAAPDSAAQTARDDLRASLLYRARRYEAAAAAYRSNLSRARVRRPISARAEPALGLARSLRARGQFNASDSAFVLAADSDSAGTVREAAAWERSREWEDQKPPAEAAQVLRWARARVRTEPLASTVRVHEAIAWIRADSLAAADSALTGPGPEDARVHFWRGWIASARGDSLRARDSYRRAWEADPWSYEGVRARELSGLPVEATQGVPGSQARHVRRATQKPPSSARLLSAVGFRDLSVETLRSCATGEAEPRANGCVDALEEEGIYRVGRADLTLDLRLRFPPAFAGAVFRAAEAETLSAPFIWSIMRLESGYNPTARSRAGALGLLQLILPTASRLAGRPVSEASLTDPDLNVRLGTKYLRQLASEFGDLRPVAAAYNGGEEAVRRWIAARPRVDDLWVELIPYRETRDYVKQIYAAMRRYEAVYESAPTR